MAIVPMAPLGTGVTVGDAPSCKPLGPTGAPGTMPSDEVAPSEGVAMPTWANAGLQHNMAVANINNDLIEDPYSSGRIAQRAAAGTVVGNAAEAMAFIFMAVDKG
jgi:hypothetical protein